MLVRITGCWVALSVISVLITLLGGIILFEPDHSTIVLSAIAIGFLVSFGLIAVFMYKKPITALRCLGAGFLLKAAVCLYLSLSALMDPIEDVFRGTYLLMGSCGWDVISGAGALLYAEDISLGTPGRRRDTHRSFSNSITSVSSAEQVHRRLWSVPISAVDELQVTGATAADMERIREVYDGNSLENSNSSQKSEGAKF